jgi:hypothetical protein
MNPIEASLVRVTLPERTEHRGPPGSPFVA